jgi:hypothetical protein
MDFMNESPKVEDKMMNVRKDVLDTPFVSRWALELTLFINAYIRKEGSYNLSVIIFCHGIYL